MLVVKYLDVGRRGQLGGGDKRADSCDRHEARQGSPPFNPAQDQLGRDDMVAGEDGLADFCEFGIDPLAGVGSSTAPGQRTRVQACPSMAPIAPGRRLRQEEPDTGRGSAAMPACLSWVLSLSKDLPRPRCER